MTDLRTAAQQALEALEMSRRFVYADNRPQCDDAITNLRAAPAQQAEPLNLRDPAVQKRLASQWGYVPAAAQAEPVACPCGDRRVDQCPGEWEPGCDLGSNAKYALAQQANHLTIERLRVALVASRIIDPAAVEDPDGYDDGVTLFRIEALHRRLT